MCLQVYGGKAKSQKPPITHLIHYLFAICNCYACSYYSKQTDGYLAHIVIITTIYIVYDHIEVRYKINGEHSLSSLKHYTIVLNIVPKSMLSISIAVCILCSTLAVVYCYVLLFKIHPLLLHHATSSLYFICILVLTHYASEGKYQGGGVDLLFFYKHL